MKKIVIIGTDPPCPRCGLLYDFISAWIRDKTPDVLLEHWSYDDPKSLALAGKLGLTPGTAKDVAKRTGREIDGDRIKAILGRGSVRSHEYADFPASGWSPELDEYLRPWEEIAREAGILMTPVLVIDGEVRHEGSVPSRNNTESWLRNFLCEVYYP